MAKRRRQVSRRIACEARKSSKLIGGMRSHTPPGLRKSGMPDSVEMPAPVNTTTRRAWRIISVRRSVSDIAGLLRRNDGACGAEGKEGKHRVDSNGGRPWRKRV